MTRLLVLVLTAGMLLAACGDDGDGGDGEGAQRTTGEQVTLTLMTHDSFATSEGLLDQFTEQTGIKVKVLPSGDAGEAVNQAILTKGKPLGDVLYGIDNTFLTRALDAGIFVPYEAAALDQVPDAFELDATHRVTPIDYGDVCINFDKEAFGRPGTPPVPATLDDLTKPDHKGKLVVENPATSSPGLAFLLATIVRYGEDGWRDYWSELKANDVLVTSGWEEAYNESFSGGSGKGDRPLVVSYASSPPAEVVFAEEPKPTEAPTGVMADSCFRQVEFAGILDGTDHEEEAGKLIDFLLSKTFQEDMPLNMFVFPVLEGAALPEEFTKHAVVVDEPLEMPPADIGRNRERWIQEWQSLVLG